MAKNELAAATTWITPLVTHRPDDLPRAVAERAGCSAGKARRLIKQLVALGWLERQGHERRPHYAAGRLRQVVQRYPLAGLSEDLPWARDFAPYFTLPAHVQRMVQHAFTELLNNAIDHSEGSSVTLSLRQTGSQAQLLVSDDGRGVFDKIQQQFAIEDPVLAMLELAKGKLTSAPDRHTGRGLYFSARLADVFDLHANATAFQHRGWEGHAWRSGRPMPRAGTSIYLAISLDTSRTLDGVLRAASLDGDGYGFERTHVPLRLITSTGNGLESRAQARRVASRLGDFARAELDFDGISDVGHAFADELFRVFARAHPKVELVPLNMPARVASMVASVSQA